MLRKKDCPVCGSSMDWDEDGFTCYGRADNGWESCGYRSYRPDEAERQALRDKVESNMPFVKIWYPNLHA